uniref:SSD domain-containing protein n=1 Tax=Candidatus Kentrum sp. TUN TaxID=2126343 RepID=A0A450ZTM6_9GAMM|nr:MAG: hypothetical protein BECKTUN1418F_GA0071002_11053 [Candidatus Kentron sp. TUN]VFK65147.1 MAG: hypothetical protein BECKTUN1418E_GA0071001_11023 [Candidatus Kentron sp. TUN]
MLKNAEQTLAAWIIRYRWWFLILMPLLVLALANGMKALKFSIDYRMYFSEDNPHLQAFNYLEKTYTQDDNVIFLLIPEDGQVFTRETLTAVEALTEMAWQLPYSLRVDSLSNFQYTSASNDDLIVRDLIRNADRLSGAEIAEIRRIALEEPLIAQRLVPKEANATIINVTIQLPRVNEIKEVPEVTLAAREMVDKIRADYPHIDVRLSGIVVMNNTYNEASQNDMGFLVPISFGVMGITLVLLLRGAMGTLTTFIVIIMSILSGMGAGGYLGLALSPPSSISPTIILTIVIANSVHILVVFYHQLRLAPSHGGKWHGKMERQAAMQESLRINLQPIFLTSLTTIIGFLSLNLSEVPPFRDLGNFVSAGVGISFLLSLTFLPALMMLLPVRVRHIKANSSIMDRLVEHIAEFVVHHRNWLLWTIGGVVIILISFIPRNELNDNFINYFDESISFRRDTDLLDKHLGGVYGIDYSLDTHQSNGIHDPIFLAKVEAFAQWLRQQPKVLHVNTITDTLKRLNRNLHGDDPTWYRLPENRELAAQSLLLYEMSLPYGLDLNNQINVDKSATRIRISTRTLSTNEVLALEKNARQWLEDNAPELVAQGMSPAMMFSHVGARNIRAMLSAVALALVLISLILILGLRSFKIGLISMLPNLIPVTLAFGIWGILVGEINLALSLVITMTIGIVVDDTIHFLSKYLRARREYRASSEDAVRYAFLQVGPALITTSLVLVIGFLVLTLSSFYLNSSMGVMVAMVISIALVISFLLLPTLLMKLRNI